ncbi:MAG: phosphoheptose isomerase [Gammaproteobacteria bacterium RIFCSPHIGHO2_12_FULL_40_19]|nr:MAG: phosphoheptose isomerase [Gammaproteobacteria bacterium RIFCSPHIGHO2_12_FULL_40_19]
MLNILESLREHQQLIQLMEPLIPKIEKIAIRITEAVLQGGTVFWMGNGGSAADAQHLAAELVGRFKKERRAIPSLSLSTDTSVLTCLSNDYDYSVIFARQLEALCRPGDVVIGLSTSGNSLNVLKGFEMAQQKSAHTIALTGGTGGKLLALALESLIVPSSVTARIQEAHIFLGHVICEWVENAVEHSQKLDSVHA